MDDKLQKLYVVRYCNANNTNLFTTFSIDLFLNYEEKNDKMKKKKWFLKQYYIIIFCMLPIFKQSIYIIDCIKKN